MSLEHDVWMDIDLCLSLHVRTKNNLHILFVPSGKGCKTTSEAPKNSWLSTRTRRWPWTHHVSLTELHMSSAEVGEEQEDEPLSNVIIQVFYSREIRWSGRFWKHEDKFETWNNQDNTGVSSGQVSDCPSAVPPEPKHFPSSLIELWGQ